MAESEQLLMGFGAGGVHPGINTLKLVVEIGLMWTGAWHPYSLDRVLLPEQRQSASPLLPPADAAWRLLRNVCRANADQRGV